MFQKDATKIYDYGGLFSQKMKTIKERVREIYERYGDYWVNFSLMNNDFIILIKKNTNKRDKVLDLGCGGGRLAVSINNYVTEVVGIDISINSLRAAQRAYMKKNVRYAIMDGENLGFKDDAFDVVVSHAAINKITCRADRVFEEVRRCLKNGGKLMAITIHRDGCKELGVEGLGYDESELVAILRGLNFCNIATKTVSQRFVAKDLEELTFLSKTEIAAIVPAERLRRFYSMAEEKKDYSFMNTSMMVYAECRK